MPEVASDIANLGPMSLYTKSEVHCVKKGICYGCLPGDLDMKERLTLAKDAGFDGVELSTFEEEAQWRQAKEIAEDLGLALHSVMGGIHWQCPLSSPDEDVRRKGIDGMADALRGGQIVGATTVLLVPGVVNEETTYESALETSHKSIEELIPVCEETGVVLALENVWNKFLLGPPEFCQFIDDFESDWIKAYFDVGNILLWGYPQHWIRSLADRLAQVHLKDFIIGPKQATHLLGGDVPWKDVMAALRDIGYDGYLTAEIGPYTSDPKQSAYDISTAIDEIIAL